MAKTGGRQVQVGMGIEATPGTAVAETIFLPWTAFSVQAVSEKELFNSARGIRNMASNSMIKRQYSQGSITVVPNVVNAPYFFGLALGTVNSSSIVDSGYIHTITVQEGNASMKTATLTIEEGGVQTAQYTNVVCDSLNLEVSDGYASMTMEVIGQFATTDTITEAYTEETEFAYHQMTAKFGTGITAAASAGATPLKAFTLNVANNVQIDEAFLSGANTITSGGLCAGPQQVTGSYTLHFEDTTELAKYKANTKDSMVVQFLGATIGASEQEEIRIDLAKLVLTAPPVEYNIDGLLVLTQEFEVEYGATDTSIVAIVDNEVDGTDY